MIYLGDQTFLAENSNIQADKPIRSAPCQTTEFSPNVNFVYQRMCWRLGTTQFDKFTLPILQDYIDVVNLLYCRRASLEINTGSIVTVLNPPRRADVIELDFEGWFEAYATSYPDVSMPTARAKYLTEILSGLAAYFRGIQLAVFGVPTDGITDDTFLKQPTWTPDTVEFGKTTVFIDENKGWLRHMDIVQSCGYFGQAKHDQIVLDYVRNYSTFLRQVYPNMSIMTTIMGMRNESWNLGVSESVPADVIGQLVLGLNLLHTNPIIKLKGAFIWGIRLGPISNELLLNSFGVKAR